MPRDANGGTADAARNDEAQAARLAAAVCASAGAWAYKGEGNMNIVCSYRGAQAELAGFVLRVKKTTDNEASSAPPSPPAGTNVIRRADASELEVPPPAASKPPAATADKIAMHQEVFFVTHVMRPILGEEHVGDMILIPTTPAFLRALADAIRPARPKKRLHKDVDLEQENVILVRDFTLVVDPGTKEALSGVASQAVAGGDDQQAPLVDSLCIELKPKCAYKPFGPTSPLSPVTMRHRYCRFCMHQLLKHDIPSSRSKYCPLELFSGSLPRVRTALDAMWDTGGNTCKIFGNGQALRGFEEIAAFLARFTKAENDHGQTTAKMMVLDSLAEALCDSNLLVRLKVATILLDCTDLDKIVEIYNAEVGYSVDNTSKPSVASSSPASLAFDSSREFWNPIVSYCVEHLHNAVEGARILVAQSELEALSCSSCEDPQTSAERRMLLRKFLVAATLKDCSIMCTASSPHGKGGSAEHTGGQGQNVKFHWNLQVVDLDPKSATKIPKYRDLEKEIVERCWKEYKEGGIGKDCCGKD